MNLVEDVHAFSDDESLVVCCRCRLVVEGQCGLGYFGMGIPRKGGVIGGLSFLGRVEYPCVCL